MSYKIQISAMLMGHGTVMKWSDVRRSQRIPRTNLKASMYASSVTCWYFYHRKWLIYILSRKWTAEKCVDTLGVEVFPDSVFIPSHFSELMSLISASPWTKSYVALSSFHNHDHGTRALPTLFKIYALTSRKASQNSSCDGSHEPGRGWQWWFWSWSIFKIPCTSQNL